MHPKRVRGVKDANGREELLERALAETKYLTETQRDNVRYKARDLADECRVWESTPFRVILESNRRCNLSCMMCDNVHAGNGVLPARVIETLYESIGWGAMEILPFGAGEPTLSPMSFLAPLARRHNQFFNFITNGVLFTRAYFEAIADVTSRVQFSLHSHRPEVAESIAPGQGFERVVRNLRDAVRIGEATEAHILSSLVVMDRNLDDLPSYVQFVADLGVKRILFSRLFPTSSAYAQEGIELHRSPTEVHERSLEALEVALANDIYLESNLEALVNDPRNRPHLPSRFDFLHENAQIVELFGPKACISSSVTVFVEWDGTVLPCFQGRIPLGNLNRDGWDAIWNGERMQRHRASFFEGRPDHSCAECQTFFCGHA